MLCNIVAGSVLFSFKWIYLYFSDDDINAVKFFLFFRIIISSTLIIVFLNLNSKVKKYHNGEHKTILMKMIPYLVAELILQATRMVFDSLIISYKTIFF